MKLHRSTSLPGTDRAFALPAPASSLLSTLARTWGWISRQRGLHLLQPRARRLQVHETVQLGEKRFVSILRVDGEQFLIGGSPTGISLLAALNPDQPGSFASVLETVETEQGRQACA